MRTFRLVACALAAATVTSVAVSSRAEATVTIPVYLFAGQSNMSGFAAYTNELPLVAPTLVRPTKRVQFFGPLDDSASRWGTLQAPTEVQGAKWRSGFGPELSAARALTWLHPDTDIAIVKYARGSTNLYSDWKASSGPQYVQFIERVRSAIAALQREEPGRPIKIAGLFWMQGENDSDTAAHAQAYGANLTDFISAVRRDLGAPDLPVVIGQVSTIGFPPTWRYSYMVGQQQRQVADADPHAYLVSTVGLEHSLRSPIHFSTRGIVDLGYRFVQRSFNL